MPIAYVSLPGRGATDALIASAVDRLRRSGLRLAGTVQTDVPRAGRTLCDMELAVLPDGPVFRINQDRGEAARAAVWMAARWKRRWSRSRPAWPGPRC